MLTGVIPNHQGEIRLLLQNIGKEDSIWNIGMSIGCFFLAVYPLTKINEKQAQLRPPHKCYCFNWNYDQLKYMLQANGIWNV